MRRNIENTPSQPALDFSPTDEPSLEELEQRTGDMDMTSLGGDAPQPGLDINRTIEAPEAHGYSREQIKQSALELGSRLKELARETGTMSGTGATGQYEATTESGLELYGRDNEKAIIRKNYCVQLHIAQPDSGKELYVHSELGAYFIDTEMLTKEDKRSLLTSSIGDVVHNSILFVVGSKNHDFRAPVHREQRFHTLLNTEAVRRLQPEDLDYFASAANLHGQP